MRIQLKSDVLVLKYYEVIQKILSNIIFSPSDEKFRRLRLSNEKIKEAITNVEQSRLLLELVGFEEVFFSI